jgi:hypothetical protein
MENKMIKSILGDDMSARSRGHRIRHVLLVLCAVAVAGIVVLVLSAALFLTRPFTEAPWEDAPANPDSIYENREILPGSAADIPGVSPFHLQTDPMEALLLINFERDPDSIYVGFEPQAFDDTVHGRGMLVIGWRVDGTVDVFHDVGLRLDPRTYGIAGKGLHTMAERSFSDALFEVGPAGVQADIAFHDLQGRLVHLLIRETDLRPRNHFGFLAPMGSAASDPPALPLVYVDGFYFVRRAGTEYRIEIDGRSHRNDPIPLILDGTRVHFLRYSADPFIVTWNPDAEARIRVLEPSSGSVHGAFVAHADGVRYDMEANGAFHEIRRISRREGDHEVAIEFTPAFPQLMALADGVDVTGEFRITAQPSVGTVRGSWRVVRQGGELHLEVAPDGGWTPGPAPRMARLLFRVESMFRTWPATYVWRGTIQLPPLDMPLAEAIPFQSGWERITQ